MLDLYHPATALVVVGCALVAVGALLLWATRAAARATDEPRRRTSTTIRDLPDSAWVTDEVRRGERLT